MTQAIEIFKSDLAQYRKLIESVLTILENGDTVTTDMLEDWDQDTYHIYHAGLNVKWAMQKAIKADDDTTQQLVQAVKAHHVLINKILDGITLAAEGSVTESTVKNWREELLEIAE